jgi:hypothetical protein
MDRLTFLSATILTNSPSFHIDPKAQEGQRVDEVIQTGISETNRFIIKGRHRNMVSRRAEGSKEPGARLPEYGLFCFENEYR